MKETSLVNNFASGCRRSLGIPGRWALSLNKNVYTICSQVPGILRKVWGRECKSLKMGRRTMKCHRLSKTNSEQSLTRNSCRCLSWGWPGQTKSWVRMKKQLTRGLLLTEELFATDRCRRKGGIALKCALTHDLPGHQREFWSSLGGDPGRMKWVVKDS